MDIYNRMFRKPALITIPKEVEYMLSCSSNRENYQWDNYKNYQILIDNIEFNTLSKNPII